MMAQSDLLKCDICGFSTTNSPDDLATFGDWMQSHGITVHYFCLLLSTNLPQRGEDASGILGFLKRNIRQEIQNNLKKSCFYCRQPKASIFCHKCKKCFHLLCGQRYDCAFQFIGEFRSYCYTCAPLDDFQMKTVADPPIDCSKVCYICKVAMTNYNPVHWIYANCCGNGFVHRLCIRKYALSAGYYLTCIWCRSKEFRDHVRIQGVFVPDRDANWEREKNAYRELHCKNQRCDMDVCHCPKGRNYTTPKWKISVCSLCGSCGAHNPHCIPGMEKRKEKVDGFKCDSCRKIEDSVELQKQKLQAQHAFGSELDYSLRMNKIPSDFEKQTIHETPLFSDDEVDCSSVSTATTVFAKPASVKGTFNFNTQESTASKPELNKSIIAEPDWVQIKMWPEFDNNLSCIGSCTLHINLKSPRFAGKTISDICANPLEIESVLTDADKKERSTDKGIFELLDQALEELIENNWNQKTND